MTRALPPLRLLSAFAAVARTGSMQAAAAALNVTQPAVSQAVRTLEAHCGVALLDRSRRPVVPTPAGATLAQAIAEGLGRIEDTLDALRMAESEAARAVTVACSVGVATYWLMPRLASFYAAHPELSVNVITTASGAPALSEACDLAIRFGHGRWTDGTVTPLFPEQVQPVCAPDYAARHGNAVSPDRAALLHVKSEEASWLGWRDYLRGTGLGSDVRRGQTFTNYVQATQAALDGQGVMLGWRSITGALRDAGRLVPVGLPPFDVPDGFYVVARPKRARYSADVFADWLQGADGHDPVGDAPR